MSVHTDPTSVRAANLQDNGLCLLNARRLVAHSSEQLQAPHAKGTKPHGGQSAAGHWEAFFSFYYQLLQNLIKKDVCGLCQDHWELQEHLFLQIKEPQFG
ncbi:unnamed protein product [Pleuronectes platessa]|uniref:Uncharacterized protein n=1 Tax=Pleuronectes platessa TaxID=8262 RepID=A0A9N7ZF67_PLEPL|nr:unnamed protein product [Pleuronectes platessa]